jgi:hypothetical protein
MVKIAFLRDKAAFLREKLPNCFEAVHFEQSEMGKTRKFDEANLSGRRFIFDKTNFNMISRRSFSSPVFL